MTPLPYDAHLGLTNGADVQAGDKRGREEPENDDRVWSDEEVEVVQAVSDLSIKLI